MVELIDLDTQFKAPMDLALSPGKASISIRPEMLWLEDKTTERNGIAGQVEELIYVGESTKYIVAVLDKQVVIRQPRRTDTGRFSKGDPVTILFNIADMVFINSEMKSERR